MPYVDSAGVRLYYEESGIGSPIVFVHEFAGDFRSWEPQMRYFSRRYHCIAFNARGFPPSDVPSKSEQYNQDIARDDIYAVMKSLKIEYAHIVGCSMGAFATLHFAFKYPDMAKSIVVAGCGYGAKKDSRDQFQNEAAGFAAQFEEKGMRIVAAEYSAGPTRVQYQNKDPRGYLEFQTQFAEHSEFGSAMTLVNVQAERPSLYDLEEDLKNLSVPTLLITGDEDEPCLDPNVFMKRTIPSSGLVILPKTGHAANLEEPDSFNDFVQGFFSSVENGRWDIRDPRSKSTAILSTTSD